MKLFHILLAVLVLSVSLVWADEKKSEGETHDSYPPVQVTEHHKVLLRTVGDWEFTQKYWMEPGSKAMTSSGTSSAEAVLGGRAVLVHVENKGPHMEFQGVGLYSWDAVNERYVATWSDIYSYTGMDTMVGTYDKKANTMTWRAKMTLPNGMEIPYQIVETFQDDKFVMRFYMTTETGKKFKMMENVYTRVAEEE